MRSFWSCLGASVAAGVTVVGGSGVAATGAAASEPAAPAAGLAVTGMAASEPAGPAVGVAVTGAAASEPAAPAVGVAVTGMAASEPAAPAVGVAVTGAAASEPAAPAAGLAVTGMAASEPAGPAAARGEAGQGDLLRLGFQLVNLNSRLCLTVTAGGLDDNAILIQGTCERDASYRWRFVPVEYTGMVLIENVKSGKCLTVAGDSIEDNGLATQLECGSDPAEQWRVRKPAGALLSVPVGDALLQNGRSHKCLTIAGGSAAENGVAVQYNCDTERSRRWSIRLVAGPALA
jgi:hypothetical protein